MISNTQPRTLATSSHFGSADFSISARDTTHLTIVLRDTLYNCSELLDAVVMAPSPSLSTSRQRAVWAENSKLTKWEAAVDSDARRVVKLLFADYKAKKELLSKLLSRDVVSAAQAQ